MTPSEALSKAVTSGYLDYDDSQMVLAHKLTHLTSKVKAWKGGKSGLFAKIIPSPKGLYIWGGVGTGKSLMMDLFFKHMPFQAKRRVHFHQFLQDLQARITLAREKNMPDPLKRVARQLAKDTRVLCFDELQVTDVGDAMILGRVFQTLFEEGVVILATSNRPPHDLYKNGLNRQLFEPFIELIENRLDVFQLDSGIDYRLARLQAAPIYYSPLGPKADRAMDSMFKQLIMDASPRQGTLSVKSRRLVIPQMACDVARFSFDELCNRPLGPSDYYALALNFHTIMVDDIPKLSPKNRDQAKRFVTLIDQLYEIKTKLVASAAEEPDQLYPDGDYAFEFQRTASRLIEMRSEEYLAAERRVEAQHAPLLQPLEHIG